MSASHRAPLQVVILALLAFQTPLSAVPIRFLAWDDEIAARKIGFQSSKGVNPIPNLHPGKRTEPMDAGAVGAAPLQLVALDRTSPDGKPVTVEIKLLPTIQSPLVLILPDSKNPSGLRPFVIEDSSASFAWGSIRIINATGKALLIRNEKTITALPETWTPVDLSPGGDARNIGVQLVARDDLKAILYSAVWEHDPNLRKLVFVVPGTDARAGGIDFKILPEDRRAVAAEAAAAQAGGTN